MTKKQTKGLLNGKKGLITGIANEKSIAYAIAKIASEHGAELAITYQADKLESRVQPLAEELGASIIAKCDVSDDESISALIETINIKWGVLDFIIHAVAFADRSELQGKFIDTSLDNFLNTLHISCYSLTAICKRAHKLMNNGGSIITLSYLGSEKVLPNYNVMGVAKAALEASVRYLANDLGPEQIRVNAISAGPIKTLAAAGIGDFRKMLKLHQSTAPLRRNTTSKDVAGAALYLLSDLSQAVTGEIHFVDCGYKIMGMTTDSER